MFDDVGCAELTQILHTMLPQQMDADVLCTAGPSGSMKHWSIILMVYFDLLMGGPEESKSQKCKF